MKDSFSSLFHDAALGGLAEHAPELHTLVGGCAVVLRTSSRGKRTRSRHQHQGLAQGCPISQARPSIEMRQEDETATVSASKSGAASARAGLWSTTSGAASVKHGEASARCGSDQTWGNFDEILDLGGSTRSC